MKRFVKWMADIPMHIVVMSRVGVRRLTEDKRGLATLEMVALSVVIVGAVVGMGAVISEGFRQILMGLWEQVMVMLGLK